ncbi:MAG: porphobilinogen synthase [Planctomycetes bacterium]|nr:porphobilinogen synthase [Planctomycetota bacterium]
MDGNSRIRPRRLRRNPLVRDIASEVRLGVLGMIQPYFVQDGKGRKDAIESLPGIHRESVDELLKTVAKDADLGVRNAMLFGIARAKDSKASGAVDANGAVVNATKKLKKEFGEDLTVFTDVCLCAYTDHGHCGLVEGEVVVNDRSVETLREMAGRHAEAGADFVCPSDMMDHRIRAIRDGLDKQGFVNTGILSYAAKYASAYYGPFREAADSAPGHGDRKSYQMDFRNFREALREVKLDEEEGADIVMVKPALAYLDVIRGAREAVNVPVAAYNVSGEYAAVKLLAKAGYADEGALTIENLTAITRAGASIIVTYHLRDILENKWL